MFYYARVRPRHYLRSPVSRTRRVIIAIVVIFCLYAIYAEPAGSGKVVQATTDTLTTLIQSLFKFFDALLRR